MISYLGLHYPDLLEHLGEGAGLQDPVTGVMQPAEPVVTARAAADVQDDELRLDVDGTGDERRVAGARVYLDETTSLDDWPVGARVRAVQHPQGPGTVLTHHGIVHSRSVFEHSLVVRWA